jgi:hypothetical protein
MTARHWEGIHASAKVCSKMSEPPFQTPRTAPSPTPNGQPAKDVNTVDPDPSPHDISTAYDRESPPGTPRWVKLLGIAFVVLALLFAGLHLTGNGGGPGLHGAGAEHATPMP